MRDPFWVFGGLFVQTLRNLEQQSTKFEKKSIARELQHTRTRSHPLQYEHNDNDNTKQERTRADISDYFAQPGYDIQNKTQKTRKKRDHNTLAAIIKVVNSAGAQARYQIHSRRIWQAKEFVSDEIWPFKKNEPDCLSDNTHMDTDNRLN